MGVSKAVYIASNGQKIVTCIPGVYPIINTDATEGAGFASDRNVCYVGEAYAGQGQKLLSFNDEIEAKRVLLGGDLYNKIYKGFNCSPDFRPPVLYAMQPGENVQGTMYLKDSLTNNVIKLYTALYGSAANGVSVIVGDGTLAGSKKITIRNGTVDQEIIDNILYQAFTLTTSKGTTTATVTIDETSLVTEIDSVEDLNISFTDYPTLKRLVDFINAQTGYTATLVGDPEMMCENLDHFTASSIKSPTTLTVTANIQYTIDLLNQNSVLLEKAELASGVTTVRSQLANMTETFFTGGDTPTVTTTDWDDMLTALEKEDIQGVVCCDDSQTIILKVQAFINKMWGQNYRKFPIAFAGSDLTDTDSEKKDFAKLLNDKSVNLCGANHYDLDEFGREVEMSGVDLAAKCGGIMASTDIVEPLTFKRIRATRIKTELSPTAQEEFIQAGIIMLKKSDVDGEIEILRSITTYQSDNLQLNEYSIVRTEGWMSRDRFLNLQSYMERPYKNRKTLPGDLKSRDRKRLDTYIELGYLAVDPNGVKQTVSKHELIQQADKFIIKSKVLVTAPDNFVFLDQEFDLV